MKKKNNKILQKKIDDREILKKLSTYKRGRKKYV